MRLLLLLLGFLVPFLAAAQYRAGSHVLATDSTVRHPAQLKLLAGNRELALKNTAGEKTSYTPKQVLSFRIGQHQYIRASNFTINMGLSDITTDQAFVEQVDSGGVVLARYLLQNGAGVLPMDMSGGMGDVMIGGGNNFITIYLVRTPPARQFVPIPYNMLGDGSQNSGTAFCLTSSTTPTSPF